MTTLPASALVSARHTDGGGVAVLDRKAFGRRTPHTLETWRCVTSRGRVELRKRDYFARRALAFERASFLVNGRLPAPAL